MRVAIHYDPPSRRSSHLAAAMMECVQRGGDMAMMVEHFQPTNAEVAFAYGWGHPEMFEAYRARGGTFVYADLGWWDRKPAGRVMDGYHKLVVGAREPLGYFNRVKHDGTRAKALGVTVAPWRAKGSFILLAGMSAKSAKTRGFAPYEWELNAIRRIREHTDRPIVFRPKPSWADAKPIEGCGFSPPSTPINLALVDCWAVVTLHSNVAVDGLCAGIPCVADEGVASTMSGTYEALEDPPLPDGREQLVNDIAWAQWSTDEMRAGLPWMHFKREGLL